MTVERMDHVGIVVEDLAAATAFFTALGLERQGGGTVEGELVDRIVGLEGVESDFAMLQVPNGPGRLELIRFVTPPSRPGEQDPPANTRGLRHLAFAVDDVDAAVARLEACGGALVGGVESYGNSYRLCYVRGPEGIIVELAERIG